MIAARGSRSEKLKTSDSIDRITDEWRKEFPEIDPIVEGIVSRIHVLAKHFAKSFDETTQDFGISYPEFQVLKMLRRSGGSYTKSPGQLAEKLHLSSGAMTNRLDNLEEAGYIERTPDPNDRRGVMVTLTDKGDRLFSEAIERQALKERDLVSPLPKAERKELADLLRSLLVNLEEQRGPLKHH